MAAITLTLNEAEQQALNQLLDTALRSAGLTAFQLVAHFSARLQAAQSEASMRPRQAPGDDPAATPAEPQ